MSKKPLFIGAIASIIAINSVFADTTVTSKTYVDTTRQATIPAAGTNANTPGSTVVTYTGTAGTIGERGILEPGQQLNLQTDANKLVTVGQVSDALGDVSELVQQATNLPTTGALDGRCEQWDGNGYTDEHCILWRLKHKVVFGGEDDTFCATDSDCASNCSCVHGVCGNCIAN